MNNTIVIDNGSLLTKFGLGGDCELLINVFPTVLGYQKGENVDTDSKDYYIGDEALSKSDALSLKYPIERGIVTNWEDMEKIWHHIFYNELKVSPENYPVVIAEPVLNPKANREKITQIMFETFNVPSLNVVTSVTLSLWATKRTTGLVVESGHVLTHVVPICDGYICPNTFFSSIGLGGRDVTEYLAKALPESCRELAKAIKEKCAYVALDFDAESNAPKDPYVLKFKSGSEISLCEERFQCTEILFNPPKNENGEKGIHQLVYDSVMKIDSSNRDELLENIILSGGNTMFPGFAERLEKEVVALFPPTMQVEITPAPYQEYGAWVGGDFMSSLEALRETFMKKENYAEGGPSIVHRMCFA